VVRLVDDALRVTLLVEYKLMAFRTTRNNKSTHSHPLRRLVSLENEAEGEVVVFLAGTHLPAFLARQESPEDDDSAGASKATLFPIASSLNSIS